MTPAWTEWAVLLRDGELCPAGSERDTRALADHPVFRRTVTVTVRDGQTRYDVGDWAPARRAA